MRVVDIIAKKRDGVELANEEIGFVVEGYTKGEIPDYQMAALLMAIYLNKMSTQETVDLTMAMAASGDRFDLSQISGIKVDKHSTGGVGDKTTMIIAPIVASLGVPVAKMSGRGLGFTGGTVDKLESFPGIDLKPNMETFISNVNRIGASVIAQSGEIAPADKKIYALRDVIGTVGNISLIASSIMSKKIASGADKIVLDVKVGSGAFMQTLEDARVLAKAMTDIGNHLGIKTIALLTNMDEPLGNAIGNILEVKESIEVLSGEGPEDLIEMCVLLASYMVMLGRNSESYAEIEKEVRAQIRDGIALKKLKEMIEAQGGDASLVDHPEHFKVAGLTSDVVAEREGYIATMKTNDIGKAAMLLGAGREKKEDEIDPTAGIVMRRKIGDFVKVGETLATLHTNREDKRKEAMDIILDSVEIRQEKATKKPLVLDKIL